MKKTSKSHLISKNVLISLRNAEEGFSTTFDEMLLINEKRPNLKT